MVACWVLATGAFGTDYADLRSAALRRCQAIDPGAYQSGLIFNPDGYRSYYLRSECFQRTAIEFRDPTLCGQVKQRRSLFSSSWGYSKAQCLKLVHQGIAADEEQLAEIRERYRRAGMRLRDFRLERNGNGRDFDFIPSFIGDYGHGYALRIELFPSVSKAAVVIHSSRYFVDGKSNLRIFIRQESIRGRLRDFVFGRSYLLRATLVLDIGNGGQGGRWSDAFIERVFPERERSSSLDKRVRF